MKYPILSPEEHNSIISSYIDCSSGTNLPYLIEGDKFQPVSRLDECDIIPIKGDTDPKVWPAQIEFLKSRGVTNKQLLVMGLIWDNCDTYDWALWWRAFKEFYREHSDFRLVLLHNNKCGFNNGLGREEQIYYDHIWNRSKCYYTDFNRILPISKIYTYGANIKAFALDTLDKWNEIDHRRVFLTPNRIYPFESPRVGYRRILKTILEGQSGFMSDPVNGVFLDPEQTDLLHTYEVTPHGGGGTYYPIANHYYKTSYISIFVETLVVTKPDFNISNEFHDISEKCYDPLIKGHFIVPFGYSGMIKDLKEMGFKFPDWIDYSYDDQKMDIIRFAMYLEEVKRLINIPLHTYNEYFEKDRHILQHNRDVFWTRPYDPLHDKLIQHL